MLRLGYKIGYNLRNKLITPLETTVTYTWLLFDADDTLFDFPKAEANALKWTLAELGLASSPAYFETYARCNLFVWKEFERGLVTSTELRTKRFRLFFDEIGIAADPQTVSPLFLQNLSLGIDLLPGAEEIVRFLKDRFHLALVTNGLADVQRPRLERSALADCFEKVFISEEIGAAKPSKVYFDAVFGAIGNPPKNEVLIIGDSLTSDMRGGIDYGIDTCWYNPHGQTSNLPVTYQITELKQLPDLLDF
jgi:2-haloacid dehalogenase